MALKWGQIK